MEEVKKPKRKGRPPKNADGPMYIYGKYTPASGAISNAYNKRNYFNVRLKKKEKLLISTAAKKCGMPLNTFVSDAVHRRIAEVLTEEETAKALQTEEDSSAK